MTRNFDGRSRSLYDLFIRATIAAAAAKKSLAWRGLPVPQRKTIVRPYLGAVSSSHRASASGMDGAFGSGFDGSGFGSSSSRGQPTCDSPRGHASARGGANHSGTKSRLRSHRK